METKKCSKCGLDKPLTEYHKNGFNKKGEQRYRGYCKNCANELEKQRYKNKRNFVDSQRTFCIKCGENRAHVLDFHHINPNEKEFTIGALRKGSKKVLQEEIDKCICLCANCHRDFHYLEKNLKITLEEYIKQNNEDQYNSSTTVFDTVGTGAAPVSSANAETVQVLSAD